MRVQGPRVAVGCLLLATAFGCTIEKLTDPASRATTASSRDADVSSSLPPGQSLLDTSITTVLVDPTTTATYSIGGAHRLFIRAGGICDLTSSYGVGTWDLPCLPATLPILITATSWYDPAGHPHVEFSPQLRFVPSATAASAQLFLRDWPGAFDRASSLVYCNESGCVDEALADSTLQTAHDTVNGFVYRRIKHFSGYEVAAGYSDSSATTTPGTAQ